MLLHSVGIGQTGHGVGLDFPRVILGKWVIVQIGGEDYVFPKELLWCCVAIN